jgi:hypothetical protein
MEAIYLVGIDPGFGSGGFVGVDATQSDQVVFSRSLVSKASQRKAHRERAQQLLERFGEPGWGDLEYTEADLQAEVWVDSVLDTLAEFSRDFAEPDLIAVESFVDQPSKAKKILKGRWKTPHTIGVLASALRPLGFTAENGRLVYQNAGTVLTQFSAELATLDQRKKPYADGVIVPGDRLVGNEHERRALVHALALSNHVNHNHVHRERKLRQPTRSQ